MKRRLCSFALAAVMLVCLLAGCGAASMTPNEARSGVVRVMTFYDVSLYSEEGEFLQSGGSVCASGTGFGVGEAGKETDVFVTNRHVVESESYERVQLRDGTICIAQYVRRGVYILLDDYAYSSAVGLDTSRAVPCKILYEADDTHQDLAVIRAANPIPGRIALPLMERDSLPQAGDSVYALGYPSSTDEATMDSNRTQEYAGSVDKVTVTNGIVSLHTTFVDGNDVRADVIQHTATVNHGNSGGPLISKDGAVAGVNTWISGMDVETGDSMAFYSIEIGYVEDILEDLRISYDTYSTGVSGGMIGLVVLGVLILAGVIAVVVILLLRIPKPGPAPAPAPAPGPGGEYRIQALSGVFAGRRFAVDGQVRIGRDPSNNDLVYPGGTKGISGIHCAVYVSGGQFYLKDLGSSYGTFLKNGQRLTPNQAVPLQKGDCFYLASEAECFVVTGKGGI